MTIYVSTCQPRKLLEDIKQAINDKKIVTWGYDNDGDFYHTPEQWNYKAWLSPTISDKYLIFGIVGEKDKDMSVETYAVYHGRFSEMLLAHFDHEFSNVYSTAQKTKYDRF